MRLQLHELECSPSVHTSLNLFAYGADKRWAGSGDTLGRNNQSSAEVEANINSVFTLAESVVGVLERKTNR